MLDLVESTRPDRRRRHRRWLARPDEAGRQKRRTQHGNASSGTMLTLQSEPKFPHRSLAYRAPCPAGVAEGRPPVSIAKKPPAPSLRRRRKKGYWPLSMAR